MSINPFEQFYRDPLYLELKTHLHIYLRRKGDIGRVLKTIEEPDILEIGAGVSPMTENYPKACFSDLSQEAMRYLREKKGIRQALTLDVCHIPFSSGQFSCVVCSEVLEHIEEDEAALREMRRVLKPGGSLILTVPAHHRYWGFDDEFAGHQRRYDLPDFYRKIRALGFEIPKTVKMAGLFGRLSMLGAVLLFKLFKIGKTGRNRKVDHGRTIQWFRRLMPIYKGINAAFAFLIRLEAVCLPLYFTSYILIHCRRRGD